VPVTYRKAQVLFVLDHMKGCTNTASECPLCLGEKGFNVGCGCRPLYDHTRACADDDCPLTFCGMAKKVYSDWDPEGSGKQPKFAAPLNEALLAPPGTRYAYFSGGFLSNWRKLHGEWLNFVDDHIASCTGCSQLQPEVCEHRTTRSSTAAEIEAADAQPVGAELLHELAHAKEGRLHGR